MNVVPLDGRQTTIVAILVLYFGKYLTDRIRFLRDFNIPDAVSGGLCASLLFGAFHVFLNLQVEFALGIRDNLLLVFFTTVGLSSKVKTLLKGGKPLVILLILAVSFLFIQNLAGVGLAALTGQKLPIGLLAGSISLSGGHGTVVAWSPIFQKTYGVASASEIGIASATFGLILGGLVGGPIARWLILKNRLEAGSDNSELTVSVKRGQKHVQIDYETMLNSILVIAVAIGLGFRFNAIIGASGLKLPDFVTCLLAGIFLTNTIPSLVKRFPWPAETPSLALVSDISLGLFLAISLMSLQLWTLVDLAGPILLILFVQCCLIALYALFVVFPAMGRTYDAAVVCAGYSGLALGATPTAMANMTAVTEQFGASPRAFIIVPLVGAFFIDIANALIIQRFLDFIR